ncbi:MAG TPA: hypothetical protein VMV79_04450 [Alphaproteobacteria bacterium]|nr:hypothetical protein [Alphaproteobacteria bacterium]
MQPVKIQVATSHEIRAILGPADDETIKAIFDTGATASEVAEAFEWLNDDDYMGAALEKKIGDRVRRVYEILQGDRDRIGRDEE